MAVSTCPNCGQSIRAHDDICDNCGVVLSPNIPLPTFASTIATSTAPHVSTSTMTACPNCHASVRSGEDICDNCGAVLATITAPTPTAITGAPVQETCPQ